MNEYNSLLNFFHLKLYFIVGLFTCLLSWFVLVFLDLVFNLDYSLNYILSCHVGIITSFILNYKFTFNKPKKKLYRLTIFYFVAILGTIVGLFSNQAIMVFSNIDFIYSSALSYFFIFLTQYTLNKLITFRK